jgi:GNAT superfamily N-acetyltransferase
MSDRRIQFLPHELGPPWERVRVEVDGELVSWMQTFTVGHRLRGVTLQSAGVVGVHTDDAHQMRGHMRFMLETVLRRAESRGVPLSTLYGVPDLYHRWGYATVMPEFAFDLATRVAEWVPTSHRIRQGKPEDLPAIARIYNSETEQFSGMRVREPERWLGPRQGLYFGRLEAWVRVLEDASGRIVGYGIGDQVDHDAQRLDVVDAQATSTTAAASIVRAMADEAVGHRVGKLAFHVHPNSRVGGYLRNLEVSFRSERPIGRSQMVRLSLPGVVLESLRLVVRREAEALGGYRPSRLLVETERGSGELALGGSLPPHRVRIPSARLTEILFGYRSALELMEIHGVELSDRDCEVLDVLFPPIDAYCYWPDRY